ITIQLKATGQATIVPADVDNGSSDGCGTASLSLDKTSFDCSNVGTNAVTLTVTDANGNSATCTATVTVVDSVAPVAVCQVLTIQLDVSGQATITPAQINNGSIDACGIASLSLSKTNFDCSNIGTNTVTLTVTDIHGNSQTCTAAVTVTDNMPPTVICSAVPGASADANCQAVLPDVLGGVTASDNCTAPGAITLSQSPAASTLVGLGVHVITVTATDAATNSATCTTTFTVTDDTAPTVICPAPTSASAGTNCLAAVPDVLGGVSASDSCSGTNGITLTQSPAAWTLVGLGMHVITVTATDAATNSASCTTTFTVSDDTAPTVTCPAPTSVSAGTNCLAAVPDVLGGVSASDSCSGTNGITLNQSPTAGTLVGLGVHVITVTATDAATNSATCTTTFTVTDDTAPTVTCPAPTSVSAGTNCLAAVPDVLGGVSASDSCSGTNG